MAANIVSTQNLPMANFNPNIGGKIRPGIKVLTKKAAQNETAVDLYNRGIAAGVSFSIIEKYIKDKCKLDYPLTPKNVPYFRVSKSDFSVPEIADRIMEMYGFDNNSEDGFQLYRLPIVFSIDDISLILPHGLKSYTRSSIQYWSEQAQDGTRYCKTYAEPTMRNNRAVRQFGGRPIGLRNRNDGICNPIDCPEYQDKKCNLTGSLRFSIPGIPGISWIELPTTSFYSIQQFTASLSNVISIRGRVSGLHNNKPIFYLTKQRKNVSRIDDSGKPTRIKQWITELEADIDMTQLFQPMRIPQDGSTPSLVEFEELADIDMNSELEMDNPNRD